MALVERFEPFTSTRVSQHHGITCGWQVITVDDKTLLQLNTYGKPDRQRPGKQSQTLQFDRGGAEQLMKLIRGAFPGID